MANPRRSSDQSSSSSWVDSVLVFLKRPHAFPFLLFLFLLLTWLSLRLHRPSFLSSSHQFQSRSQNKGDSAADADAKLVRFSAALIAKDRRGWLLNPVTAAREAGIHGGAQFCASVHAGEIQPGGIRGNHRHHTCNETFLIWGANTKFRLENALVEGKGYAEVIITADEVAVAASPGGTAHALINVDSVRTTFFLGCQDNIINYNSSTTDYKVWGDL